MNSGEEMSEIAKQLQQTHTHIQACTTSNRVTGSACRTQEDKISKRRQTYVISQLDQKTIETRLKSLEQTQNSEVKN